LICPTPKAKYFCKQDWTDKKSADQLICPSGSFVADDDGRLRRERRASLAPAEKSLSTAPWPASVLTDDNMGFSKASHPPRMSLLSMDRYYR
jgi:hypothetical protein